VFTRSFKYHRPRGLYCMTGDCPNCLMHVDGTPNVRTCIEPAREGQVVTHQNAWPSLGFDLLRTFDKLDRWLPVGFYYKRFHRPRWLWPLFEHVVRHVAGLGRIDMQAPIESHAVVEHLHTGVCVVGSGPAGLAAARAAHAAGADVLLLDRQPRLGGHLLAEQHGGSDLAPTADAIELQSQLAGLEPQPGLRVLNDTVVFGLYEDNLVGAFRGDQLLKIRAGQVIVCTGGRERPTLFHNNDLPGVMLGRAALRLAAWYGVRPGQRAVVLTSDDSGSRLAERLTRLGVTCVAIVDERREPPATASGIAVLAGSRIVKAQGNAQLKAVQVVQCDEAGAAIAGSERELACDLLCLATPLEPAAELAQQRGVRFQRENGVWRPSAVPGVWVAGAAAGTREVALQVLEGRLRGAEAAAALGLEPTGLTDLRRRWDDACRAGTLPSAAAALPPSTDSRYGRKRFVCLCEDVTEKDIEQAIAEGFDEIETLKRYSTASMGPCQGRQCGAVAGELCARFTGRDRNTVGTTTSRPPATPVPLGVLAATAHHPVRRTPLHHWHGSAGARWMDAGQWKRPETYGDPIEEIRAVRCGVGIIDVSTLGKFELVGSDAGELLDRIYLNRWSDLKPGRVRYGVMCNEDGILYDDGVGTRLDANRFYLTATTGNSESVLQWLELWKTAWRLNVTVLSHTSGVAAMNLAGPRARDVLRRATRLDVSAAAFPYMAAREADVAGAPCRLFRMGFVGELGYEIHCSSACAGHVWQALGEAGRDCGIVPFGVEAQRVLRLEKGHLIIGVDTDALSTPLEAGLESLVKFDKPQFHGRGPLLRLRDRPARNRLVGFVVEDGAALPDEGCQVVDAGRPVGRVTSARYSPTLSRRLGLAWVPADRSRPGERFLVRHRGVDVTAIVTAIPFYDPQGERQRS
jgi:sarcosine oxidase subunit alpha